MTINHVKCYIKDYPRPQFVRKQWENLNGKWDFYLDYDNIGDANEFFKGFIKQYDITVPFAYSCKASGIDLQKQCKTVWYSKKFIYSTNDIARLTFEGSDYKTSVYVNGLFVGVHEGGYTRFSFDINNALIQGSNLIVVKVEDSFSCNQPRGKQRWLDESFGCWYVETTGIWKTVWIEYVNNSYIENMLLLPNYEDSSISFEGKIAFDEKKDVKLKTKITFKDVVVAESIVKVNSNNFKQSLDIISPKIDFSIKYWTHFSPSLYDIEYELIENDIVVDKVGSYFGFVKYEASKNMILQNNVQFYAKMILDQGYFNESGLTPKTEDDLLQDIKLTKELGFNGIRKHQKIEDDRFYYLCDVLGVIVWLEMPSFYEFSVDSMQKFTNEWIEVVKEHSSHPSIMAYVTFNESWGLFQIYNSKIQQNFSESIYYLTKSIDPNKFVISNDGWEHTKSDIITLHNYAEYGSDFEDVYNDLYEYLDGKNHVSPTVRQPFAKGFRYENQPVIISEYAGISFAKDKHNGWGYGKSEDNEEAFLKRYDSLTTYIKQHSGICGFCVTQTTDVYQEVNGLLTVDRRPKVSIEKIAEINNKKVSRK